MSISLLSHPYVRLDAAVAQFPFLSALLGHRRKPLVLGSGEISEQAAHMMCRAAFLPTSLTRRISAGLKAVLRARAFMTRFILRMQVVGMAAMFTKLSSLVRRPDGSSTGNVVVVGLSHSWDETKQMLREHKETTNPFLKQPSARIGRNVLVQTSMVHATGIIHQPSGVAEVYHRAESVLVPPLELAGKTTGFLAKAILDSMALPLHRPEIMRQISSRVSALVVTMWGDGASTNVRFLKHLCGLCDQDEWPVNVLLDPSEKCMLHQLHRIRIRQLEGHALVSLSYCFARLVRSGAILGRVVDHMTVHLRTCKRVVSKPPEGSKVRLRKAFDLLYKLDGSHHVVHNRRGAKPSELLADVQFLMQMDSAMLERGEVVHYCWDNDTGKPCCRSKEETVQKMVAAYLNLFTCHGCPSGSLSRWTHVGVMFTQLAAGFVCRDVFYTAVQSTLQGVAQREAEAAHFEAGVAGAGDADFQKEHQARLTKVRAWLSLDSTRLHVGVMVLVTSITDALMYFLMGGNTRDGARSRRPATIPRLDEPLPVGELVQQVLSIMATLGRLLEQWHDLDADSWVLLHAMGVDTSSLEADQHLRFVRRQCIGFSVGIFRRFVLRLRAFPYQLWVLADGTFDDATCRRAAESFLRLPDCCVGFFGKRLRLLCPTVAALLSSLGRATVASWLRTLIWSVYGCEKEHASCRRLLLGAGPSRNWTLCARERLLECSRTVHLERTSCDPGRLLPDRPTPVQHLAAAVDGTARNPLLSLSEQGPGSIEFNIDGVDVASDLDALVAMPGERAGQDQQQEARLQIPAALSS